MSSNPTTSTRSGPVAQAELQPAIAQGGPPPPHIIQAEEPTISIVAPVHPVAGVAITVSGTYTTGHGSGTSEEPPPNYELVSLSLQVNGTAVDVQTTGVAGWSATVAFPSPGSVTPSATIVSEDDKHRFPAPVREQARLPHRQ